MNKIRMTDNFKETFLLLLRGLPPPHPWINIVSFKWEIKEALKYVETFVCGCLKTCFKAVL